MLFRSKNEGCFIASKEKALADLVYKTPHIRTVSQLRSYLFEEMRLDEEMFKDLDFTALKEIAEKYDRKSIHMIRELQ